MGLFEALTTYTQENLWASIAIVFFSTLLVLTFWNYKASQSVPPPSEAEPIACGDITLETLQKYSGADPFKPIYIAVKGTVYDVTPGRDFYGPGGGYAVFAGKEVSRALGKMSLKVEDCNSNLEGLTARELQILQEWEDKMKSKYAVVGQVIPPKSLTLEELAQFDGSIPDQPIYLAIRGTVFDVTAGKDFYGPEGIYPFAGKECAYAFAMLSTELEDCHDNLDGLSATEWDYLHDWESKFYYKYPVIGHLVKRSSTS